MAKKQSLQRTDARRMRPRNANANGDVFGGDILKYMDDAALTTAEKYAGEQMVTASISRMSFKEAVDTDDLLLLETSVDYVGDSSVTVNVDAYVEDLGTAAKKHTASAYITYVAEDEDGETVSVPDLDMRTIPDERYDAAEKWKNETVQHAQQQKLPEPDAWDLEITRPMRPQHADERNRILGGEILKVMDETAATAAIQYAREKVVTASLDTVSFHEPVYTDDLLVVKANVDYVGNASMVVAVDVQAEDPVTGETRETGRAYMTMVALDEDGDPTPVSGDDLDESSDRYEKAEEWRDKILADLDD